MNQTIQDLLEELDKKITFGNTYSFDEKMIDDIKLKNFERFFIARLLSNSFEGVKRELVAQLNSFIKTKVEYFSKNDREKAYIKLSKLIKNGISNKNYFAEFFIVQIVKPYWERLEALFEEGMQIIEKEKYESIMEKYQEILLRTLRIGLGLITNEREEWLLNFKAAIEIHEIYNYTNINLYHKMRQSIINEYTGNINNQIKLRSLFKEWYNSKNHTFLTDLNKRTDIINYLHNLNEYEYLFDEINKKEIQKNLFTLSLGDIDDEKSLNWIKDQIKKYL
jgi:hypothetical protein